MSITIKKKLLTHLNIFKKVFTGINRIDQTRFLCNYIENKNLIEIEEIINKEVDLSVLTSFNTFCLKNESNPLCIQLSNENSENVLNTELIQNYINSRFDNMMEIEYENVFDDEDNIYSVGVFLIPKGHYLGIHDHINMMVFSKVLYGDITIQAFDKLDSEFDYLANEGYFDVSVHETIELKTSGSSVLTPILRNIHFVRANQNSVFFDVLIPYYKDYECNYFSFKRVDENITLKKI